MQFTGLQKQKISYNRVTKIWPYNLCPDKIISTEIGEISITSDGILFIRYKDDLDFTLNKAQSVTRKCDEIANNRKMLVLVVTGRSGVMSTETREYLSGKEVAKHRKAVAIVINNLPHRIIAGFIIRVRKKFYPTEVFRNEETALLWLRYKLYE